jgi:hypothetical protein
MPYNSEASFKVIKVLYKLATRLIYLVLLLLEAPLALFLVPALTR